MRLVNVIALTNGLLVNDPFVSNFTNIISEAKAVKRGDLFIAFDKTSIKEAIDNGAYGIIYDKPTKIIDSEIAWIKVDDVSDALKRLLRFKLVEKELQIFSVDEVTLKFALQMMIDPKLVIVSGDIQNVFKVLWNLEAKTIVLFSPQLTDKDIFTNTKELLHYNDFSLQVSEHTLFESSFVYKEKLYERQMISPLFIPYLENLIAFLETHSIDFRLRKFTQLSNFEALFVNKKLQVKEFGSSERVVIFEHNPALLEDEINFLQKNTPWANSIFLVPHTLEKDLVYSNLYSYKSTKGIFSILKKHPFHFALIFGSDKSILEQKPTQPTQLTLDF